ncbi:Protein OS-9 [Cymbomonas tetramitiformis]|uniref:Protein OS-9 n=1 Tax=Cymbomonas tetramitiformis TaxID=36881 RepID=A0AAE0BTD4_9CHLO|nr:Protein OS-9 [Cymbomonas tetramitiformis]
MQILLLFGFCFLRAVSKQSTAVLSPDLYTVSFPYEKAMHLDQIDGKLRKIRSKLSTEYDCTSLDGPHCRRPSSNLLSEKDAGGGSNDLVTFDELGAKAHHSRQPQIGMSVTDKAAAEQIKAAHKHRLGHNPTPAYDEEKTGRAEAKAENDSSKEDPEEDPARPMEFATALRVAVSEIQCDLCRSMVREVWEQASVQVSALCGAWRGGRRGGCAGAETERALSGRAGAASCAGQLQWSGPSTTAAPHHRATRTDEGFALGERGEPKTLSGFEAAAFKRACDVVMEVADEEIAETVFMVLKRMRQDPKSSVHLQGVHTIPISELERMQAQGCEQTPLCVPAKASTPRSTDSIPPEMDVEKFLEEYHSGCIYVSQGWWVYELCHRKHVKQFHVEKHETVSGILLGSFDDLATSNVLPVRTPLLEAQELLPGMRQRLPHHTHVFTQGDACEVETEDGEKKKILRRVQVKFACSTDGHTHLLVIEPATCRYTIVLYLPIMCRHPKYGVKPSS